MTNLTILSLLYTIVLCNAEQWVVLKNYDLSNMESIRRDWNILLWPPYRVNEELQEYVDNSRNIYIENGEFVIRAVRGDGGGGGGGGDQKGNCGAEQHNKDIGGENLSYRHNVPQSSDCCDLCKAIQGCKAYVWNSYKGGSCWFKGSATVFDGHGTVGVLGSGDGGGGGGDKGQCGAEQHNKDISGGNLGSKHGVPKSSDCCALCKALQGCKGYAWNSFKGGSCWFKSGTNIVSGSATVAVLGSGDGGSSGGQCSAEEHNKDLYAPNVGSKSFVPKSSDCCALCQAKEGCKGYVWNNHDGGTCWFKGGTGPIVAGTGTVAVLNKDKRSASNKITSGRLESKEWFSPVKVPGRKLRVEMQARVPTDMGAWPALWMLGKWGVYGPWPQEGEIDIMEWVYQLHDKTLASLHWKGPMDWSDHFPQLSKDQIANQYITYGVEYSGVANNEYFVFYVRTEDGQTHYSQKATPSVWRNSFHPKPGCGRITPGANHCSPLAPFDNDHKLIMNLAVGGAWGGCCGVNSYAAFDGDGVKMRVKRITVYRPA